MPNYRLVYTVTKREDQDWWMYLKISSANDTTADPRDSLIKDDSPPELLAKIRDPSRWKRISYSDYTWDRTWIDDNTIELTFNFQSADKLQGYYFDWHEFSPRPQQHYTRDWKAFAPDGTAITLPSIS
jgi:hypothetical protein